MVKGTTRQVIVVEAPDELLFEQAIFLLRKDAQRRSGLREADLLYQAGLAAKGYTARALEGGGFHPLRRVSWFILGAAVGSAAAVGVMLLLY